MTEEKDRWMRDMNYTTQYGKDVPIVGMSTDHLRDCVAFARRDPATIPLPTLHAMQYELERRGVA